MAERHIVIETLPDVVEVEAVYLAKFHLVYDYAELDELVLAYAVSIHKSQGSKYPVVVITVMTQHYVVLQRNLVYTGITCGKKLVVLVGTKKTLGMAVQNNRIMQRNSWLWGRLRGGL